CLDAGEVTDSIVANWRSLIDDAREQIAGGTKSGTGNMSEPEAPSIMIATGNDPRLLDLAELLLDMGSAVQCFASAHGARQHISESTPNLLIVSESLPDDSGFTLIDDMRMSSQGARAAVILLTSAAL